MLKCLAKLILLQKLLLSLTLQPQCLYKVGGRHIMIVSELPLILSELYFFYYALFYVRCLCVYTCV